MSYSELIQQYFERSVALQWYWTVYVLVIGGVVGFSTFRQRPELITAILVAVLYGCFAYKNLGAIEATATEREAIRAAVIEFTPRAEPSEEATQIKQIRPHLEPTLPPYDIPAARNFHLLCDLLTIVYIAAKELTRKSRDPQLAAT
jgi:hypothetical protein